MSIEKVNRSASIVLTLYVWAWALEGAARKWIPGSDALGYVARDAFLVLAVAWFFIRGYERRRHHWWQILWSFVVILGMLSAVAIATGSSNATTSIFGIRAYASPILLVTFALTYANYHAWRAMARAVAYCTILNVPLVTLQVLSPAGAWINREVSGEAANFLNGAEVVRASGTFSAPIGLTSLVALGLACSLAVIITQRIDRGIHAISVASAISMVAIGGSRGAVLAAGIIVVFLLATQLISGNRRSVRIITVSIAAVASVVAAAFLVFPGVTSAFQERFSQAAIAEDSANRIWSAATGMFTTQWGITGDGPGSHSSSGAALTGNLWIEDESARWVAELGMWGWVLAGFVFASLAILIGKGISAARAGHPSPLILAGFLTPPLLWSGVTQQPSMQGAVAIGATMAILALGETSLSGPSSPSVQSKSSSHRVRQLRRNPTSWQNSADGLSGALQKGI